MDLDLEIPSSSVIINLDVMSPRSTGINETNSGTFQLCPLCNSEVRLFFINFNEKLKMCKNTECEYPFGYEEPQYFKEDNDMCSEIEVGSIREGSQAYTFSYGGSTACWSDINKMNEISYEDVDNGSFESQALDPSEYMSVRHTVPTQTNATSVIDDVKEISNLTVKLSSIEKKSKILKNREWIRTLSSLQRKSKVKLVKPSEINRKDLFLGGGELTVNIGPADNPVSAFKIEIKND